ncbi:MAG: hypothetical protein ACTSQI_07580 [Candidatus Helarchaeota archaeon]
MVNEIYLHNLDLMIATTLLIISFLSAALFYQEWRKQKRSQNEQYIPYALMILYILLFVSSILIIHSNFFTEQAVLEFLVNTKVYFLGVGILSMVIIGILVFIAERIIRKNTHHLFLIYFIIFSVLLNTLYLRDIPMFRGIFFVASIPFWFLIGLFLHRLLWKTSGEIRKKMIIAVIGFGLFLMAFTQTVVFTLKGEFELALRFKALVLLAASLTTYGFYTIPSFTEFDWPEKIRHLYILNPNGGMCIFQHSFRHESITDQDLFSGSLMAIQSLMQEMISSDKVLKTIDHEDAKILFEQSAHAVTIMIADEDLQIIHDKLQELLKEFELIFGELMEHWSGNLDIFRPLRPILDKIFEIRE